MEQKKNTDDGNMASFFYVNVNTNFDEIHEKSTTNYIYSYIWINYLWM